MRNVSLCYMPVQSLDGSQYVRPPTRVFSPHYPLRGFVSVSGNTGSTGRSSFWAQSPGANLARIAARKSASGPMVSTTRSFFARSQLEDVRASTPAATPVGTPRVGTPRVGTPRIGTPRIAEGSSPGGPGSTPLDAKKKATLQLPAKSSERPLRISAGPKPALRPGAGSISASSSSVPSSAPSSSGFKAKAQQAKDALRLLKAKATTSVAASAKIKPGLKKSAPPTGNGPVPKLDVGAAARRHRSPGSSGLSASASSHASSSATPAGVGSSRSSLGSGSSSVRRGKSPGSGTHRAKSPGSGTHRAKSPGSGTQRAKSPGSGTQRAKSPGSGTQRAKSPGTTTPRGNGRTARTADGATIIIPGAKRHTEHHAKIKAKAKHKAPQTGNSPENNNAEGEELPHRQFVRSPRGAGQEAASTVETAQLSQPQPNGDQQQFRFLCGVESEEEEDDFWNEEGSEDFEEDELQRSEDEDSGPEWDVLGPRYDDKTNNQPYDNNKPLCSDDGAKNDDVKNDAKNDEVVVIDKNPSCGHQPHHVSEKQNDESPGEDRGLPRANNTETRGPERGGGPLEIQAFLDQFGNIERIRTPRGPRREFGNIDALGPRARRREDEDVATAIGRNYSGTRGEPRRGHGGMGMGGHVDHSTWQGYRGVLVHKAETRGRSSRIGSSRIGDRFLRRGSSGVVEDGFR